MNLFGSFKAQTHHEPFFAARFCNCAHNDSSCLCTDKTTQRTVISFQVAPLLKMTCFKNDPDVSVTPF